MLGDLIRTYEKAGRKVAVLADSNSRKHCLPYMEKTVGVSFKDRIIEIPAGEEFKNIGTCEAIWNELNDMGCDRRSVLINLGGGVVGDMGGFAACTFKRGISFIQVPTTLLSQVDASVGGKLGIDLHHLKNLIGVFGQPEGVFADAHFLDTLDDRQKISGFAEMIKHGLIADHDYYDELTRTSPLSLGDAHVHIARSVAIKNKVVLEDPLEKGLRKILNFGHTIGHAVESWSLVNDVEHLLHGEAIAIGMICEAHLSLKTGLSIEELENITSYIKGVYPAYPLQKIPVEDVVAIMAHDKKNTSGKISFSLLRKIGQCGYDDFCERADVEAALAYYTEHMQP